MPITYPYTSGQGALVKSFEQFRRSVPAVIDAGLLQRFSIAPANESYVISIFRFLGIIDEGGKVVEDKTAFLYGADAEFKSGLEALLRDAYAPLFAEHGSDAWASTKAALTTWFRVSDKSSELIGGRQASTFLTLAALAGHGEPVKPASTPASGSPRKSRGGADSKPAPASQSAGRATADASATRTSQPKKKENSTTHDELPEAVGLTVRVEVNLPAAASPEVYDAIFASIRKNLIDRA